MGVPLYEHLLCKLFGNWKSEHKREKVIFFSDFVPMAEKPEDLNLPNAVIARLAKDAVSVNFWYQIALAVATK